MFRRHLPGIILLAIVQTVGAFFAVVVGLAATLSPEGWSLFLVPFVIFFFPTFILGWLGIEPPEGMNLTWFFINNLLWVTIVYSAWLLYFHGVRGRVQSDDTSPLDMELDQPR
jgi:hypothetical protein